MSCIVTICCTPAWVDVDDKYSDRDVFIERSGLVHSRKPDTCLTAVQYQRPRLWRFPILQFDLSDKALAEIHFNLPESEIMGRAYI